jgi:hypothetical protein
MQEKKAT